MILFSKVLLICTLSIVGKAADSQTTPLNKNLGVIQNEDLSRVYQDMVVVQKRAKEKSKKILFDVHGSFDFSDGPSSFYGLNTNLGYAPSPFWEIYLDVIPVFFPTERSIVKKVESLELKNGQTATITYAKPKSQVGLEVLWAPAYGKDSWGPSSIVRSDTFFKFGVAAIKYEADVGLRVMGSLGKTYFINPWFNVRLSAGIHSIQSIIDGEKKNTPVAVIESGLVFYL